MKTTTLLLTLLISTTSLLAQKNHQKDDDLIRKADSLYQVKDYKNSAFTFSKAFKANDWNATSKEHYNAACSWALANNVDSAFSNLNYIANTMNYSNYANIKADPDLKLLNKDERWKSLLEKVKANKDEAYNNIDFITLNGFKVEVLTSGMENNQAGKPTVVFENGMASGFGSLDIYVCFKTEDDKWGTPINLGDQVNTDKIERFPTVSPDGKYLFFMRHTETQDFFWVSTDLIKKIKMQSLKES